MNMKETFDINVLTSEDVVCCNIKIDRLKTLDYVGVEDNRGVKYTTMVIIQGDTIFFTNNKI